MNAEADGKAAAAEAVTPGELLRHEREQRALSVQQAAEDLHLDVWMIEAIESNRFLALGAPVYAKGHLRKYATLLGLSPAYVIELYQALSDTPAEPTPIPATVAAPVQRGGPSLKVPLWIAVAVVALGFLWWLFDDLTIELAQAPAAAPTDAAPAAREQPAPATPSPPTEEAEEPETLAVDLQGAAAPTEPEIRADSPASQAPTPALVAQNGAAVTPTGAASIRLQLEFSAPSWTEVYDGQGRRLLFKMGTPEQVRTVTGVPPLRVTLGYADAVSAHIGDRPIVIPRRTGRDSASFVIESDGTVSPGAMYRDPAGG